MKIGRKNLKCLTSLASPAVYVCLHFLIIDTNDIEITTCTRVNMC